MKYNLMQKHPVTEDPPENNTIQYNSVKTNVKLSNTPYVCIKFSTIFNSNIEIIAHHSKIQKASADRSKFILSKHVNLSSTSKKQIEVFNKKT